MLLRQNEDCYPANTSNPNISDHSGTAGHHGSMQCGHGSLTKPSEITPTSRSCFLPLGNHRICHIGKDPQGPLHPTPKLSLYNLPSHNKGDQKNPKQQRNTYFHAFISNDTYLRNLIASFWVLELLVFLEIDNSNLHRCYCFWVSADLRFIFGSYFLFEPQGHLFFFLKKGISHWHRLPRETIDAQPWRCSLSGWMQPWAA